MGFNRVYDVTGYNVDGLELIDLKFNEDEFGYYLSTKLKVEDKHSIREVTIPKIRLKFDKSRVYVKTESDPFTLSNYAWVNLGFGELPLDFETIDGQKVLYVEKVLEEKYTEMTLDEIENKLGHKIKIVNK